MTLHATVRASIRKKILVNIHICASYANYFLVTYEVVSMIDNAKTRVWEVILYGLALEEQKT